MNNTIRTRMGDGELVMMSAEEIKEEVLLGTQDAADRGNIPELTAEELKQLFDIIAEPGRVVSVSPGEEVVVIDDGCSLALVAEQSDGGAGLPLSRSQSILTYERACGADTVLMAHQDFSFKPVKSVINYEMQEYYTTSQVTTAPLFYGAQPNMGLYYQPDGPCENPSELLPMGKIKEAQQAQLEAASMMQDDIVYVFKELNSVGLECFNLDTCGSAGDADLLAALKACVEIKKINPNMPVVMGMSSEFVLGMHGEVEFDGKRLAGMYPHEQVKIVEKAGADIFGPAINVNTSKSFAWNLSRAITFVKATTEASSIPVHANVGMGVCGIPMLEESAVECVTRASKALVQIGKLDGL
jgi:dimethylamine---corrinoid protein Co-methyltransferase